MNYELPHNLDLDTCLQEAGLTIWLKPKRKEKLFYILSLLNRITYSTKDDYSQYVGLPSQHLAKIIGPTFSPQATKVLLDLGIIEKKNDSYSIGTMGKAYCKQYRFNKLYWNQPLQVLEAFDPQINKHFRKCRKKIDLKVKEIIKGIDVIDEFEQWLFDNMDSIELDSVKAKQIINDLPMSVIKKNKANQTIDNFNDRFFTRVRPDGRVFHSVCSLPKILKCCMTSKTKINSKKDLFEVDLKNFQPYALVNMFIAKKGFDGVLIEAVEKGTFYELLQSKLKEDYNINYSRETVKTKFQKNFVSGKLKTKFPSKLAQTIKKHFPEFFQFVLELQKENHLKLAGFLQKEEASIIIDGVGKHIFKHRKNTLFVTRHDSIITIEDEVEYIKELIIRGCNAKGYTIAPILETNNLNCK